MNEVIKGAGEAGLTAAALALLARANSGDVASLKELADRIDGKVPQVIGGDSDMPGHVQISWIQRTIVDPAGSSHTPYGKPSEIEGSETPAVIEAADNNWSATLAVLLCGHISSRWRGRGPTARIEDRARRRSPRPELLRLCSETSSPEARTMSHR